jgi:predicted RNase H-like HicB family nuclease
MPETKTLRHYEDLKYPIEVLEDEDAYVASIPDLPGCVAYGDTLQSAIESLRSVKKLWIQGRLDAGLPIAEPTDLDEFSGKFVLRISRGLHKALQREAKNQGLSLNQYVAQILAERHNLVDLKQVAQEAVHNLLRAPELFVDVYGAKQWDPHGNWQVLSKGHIDLVQPHEHWQQRFVALVGNKQPKTYYISLKTQATPENCWEDDALKKAKPHARA